MKRIHFIAIFCLPVLEAACAKHPALTSFNRDYRPIGYHWVARQAPGTKDTVYYGVDPSNHWQVYVGPDNVFYTFNHPGPIQPSDMGSRWEPHNIPGSRDTSFTSDKKLLRQFSKHK